MKWWYWLILELLIIFGVMAWIFFFPSEIEDDFAKGMIGFALIYAIEQCKDINRRNGMSENYTIEQNAGENRIEGGVVSISGSVDTFRCWKCGRTLPISERTDCAYMSNPPKCSCKECEGIKKEKHYIPFSFNCGLITHCGTKNIWVKSKFDSNCVLQITGYTVDDEGNHCVWLTDSWITLEKLFDDWLFLDDSPIGVEV